MDKQIKIHIRDNYDKNFFSVYPMTITSEEYCILRYYDTDKYDTVWDRLCDRIDRIMPYDRPDWYIDTIEF